MDASVIRRAYSSSEFDVFFVMNSLGKSISVSVNYVTITVFD